MKIKPPLGTLILAVIGMLSGFSQTDGILIDYVGSTRDNSAVLDLRSSTQGLLAPRLTTNQRTGISSPANGLLVYDTQLDKSYHYDAALGWTPISTSTGTITEVTADNGLTSSGGNTPNIQLGGTPLIQNTGIVQGNNDMVFDLTGTGGFEVRDNGSSALYVKDDGTVGVNTNSLDASAILDVQSANNGASAQSNADYPEPGMFKSDFVNAELIEKQIEYSKTYRNSDGSFSQTSGSIPMHFKDAKEKGLTYTEVLYIAKEENSLQINNTDKPIRASLTKEQQKQINSLEGNVGELTAELKASNNNYINLLKHLEMFTAELEIAKRATQISSDSDKNRLSV